MLRVGATASSSDPSLHHGARVCSIFTAAPEPNRSMTLFDALNEGGGSVDALLRHAVSALLSTGSQFVSYPVSARWIVDQFNAALASGDATRIDNVKNQLAAWNELEANQAPPVLTVTTAATPPATPSTFTVTDATVAPVASAAVAQWVTAGGGASALAGVTFVVGDLAPGVLARVDGQTITIERDAAGFGWYASTSAAPFTTTSGGDLIAAAGSAAAGRIDLLTVLLNLLGHTLGLDQTVTAASRVMLPTLPVGVRRTIPAGFRLT